MGQSRRLHLIQECLELLRQGQPLRHIERMRRPAVAPIEQRGGC